MRTRMLGSCSLPVVGQGTWKMDSDDPSLAIRALQTGLDLGMNHIDTAEMYGDGKAEQIVGRALVGRRAATFLVSKVLPHHASFEGTLRACEASLRRLQTDWLDLYLIHWPSPPAGGDLRGVRAALRGFPVATPTRRTILWIVEAVTSHCSSARAAT